MMPLIAGTPFYSTPIPTANADTNAAAIRAALGLAKQGKTLAFLGDSITDNLTKSVSGVLASYTSLSWGGFAAARLGHAFLPTRNLYPFGGGGEESLDFGWGGASIGKLLYSTVNELSSGANQYDGIAKSPFQAAAGTTPDGIMFLAGTNDIPGSSAAIVLERMEEAIASIAATGATAFVGELIPRMDTETDPTGAWQTKIEAVNAGLPALAAKYGATVIAWHDALLNSSGVASADFYNNESLTPGTYTTRLHPNMAGHDAMGAVFATAISAWAGQSYPIPSKNSEAWLTANPYMDTGASGLATGFTNSSSSGSTVALIPADTNGEAWQEITVPANSYAYIYAPSMITTGLTTAQTLEALFASGKKFRACCEYELVSGNCSSIELFAKLQDVGYTSLTAANHGGDINPSGTQYGRLSNHRGVLLTPEIASVDDAVRSQITFLVRFTTASVVRIRRFGAFKCAY